MNIASSNMNRAWSVGRGRVVGRTNHVTDAMRGVVVPLKGRTTHPTPPVAMDR